MQLVYVEAKNLVIQHWHLTC